MTGANSGLPGPARAAPATGASGPAPVVFTPDRRLRDQLARLRVERADLGRWLHLARRRLAHDFRARYLTSALGLPTAFVPALMVTLWAMLAHQARVISPGPLGLPYPFWVFFSVTLWQTFSEALHLQVDGLAAERNLLAKVDLPAEVLILARFGEALVQLLLKLLLGLALLAAFRVWTAPTLPLLPLLALPLALFGTACGLFLAPIAALYPDLRRTLPAITTAGFFLTPVVFPLPEAGIFRALILLNPVTPLIGFARDLAMSGIVSHPIGAAATGLLTLLMLPGGWLFYRLSLPYVLERTDG